MKTFCIKWKYTKYGESFVEAENEKMALELVENGKDYNFEDFSDTYGTENWEIESIEEEEG